MRKSGPGGRRASGATWKASSQRSRPRGKVNDHVAVRQYAKQLNPYKLPTSLRGSHNSGSQARGVSDDTDKLSTSLRESRLSDSQARGVSDDTDLLGVEEGDLDLDLGIGDGDDDDDDDMGLENILSSIIETDDAKGSSKATGAKIDGVGASCSQIKSQGCIEEPTAPSFVTEHVAEGEWQSRDVPEKMGEGDTGDRPGADFEPPLAVDLGDDTYQPRENPPIQNTTKTGNDMVSTVSEGWSDGAATKEHKLMAQRSQGPVFSSGGFEDSNRSESIPMTGLPIQTVAKSRPCLVDSIIEDIAVDDNNTSNHDSEKDLNALLGITEDAAGALGSPSGRYYSTTGRTKDPSGIKCATKSMSSMNSDDRNSSLPSKIVGIREEDSTLTEPTESPMIYTYKKSMDDDTVSQITSSLASDGRSFGNSHLQNVPTHFGAAPNSPGTNGISWMDNGVGVDGVTNRNRMIQRKGKMVIPGPYGRDRGRRSSKISSKPQGGGGWNRRGIGDGGGGGKVGGAGGASFEGGQSNLDEIAYALNADGNPRSQRKWLPSLAKNNSRDEELSTVESSRDVPTEGDSDLLVLTAKSNDVSRLGMSGVSCAAHSVSETTAASDSSSTLGLFQSLALLKWKVGRFFFPASLAVTRRKKFDRSDSVDDLEDILLEEGTAALPHRKQGGSHLLEDDDEEEVDYFSRAMSAPGNGGAPKKSKQRGKYFLYGRTARTSALFLALTMALIAYRMPEEANDPVMLSNRGAFRGNKEAGRFYEAAEEQRDQVYEVTEARDQVSDFAVGATVDRNTHLDKQADVPIPSRIKERQDQLRARDTVQPPPVQLPAVYKVLANVDDHLFQRGIDVPFFWHIPRSGGGTMNDVLGSCLHLTLAADAGRSDGHDQDEILKVLQFSQVSYVNVDTSTHQGIAHARNLNLVPSGLADVVISPLLHDASSLFIPTRRGRMFTILRNPIERAASLFYFLQESQWKQPATRNDQFADISIEEFYKKGFAENNWMTRFLSNELTKGEITENDFNIAKEVLRKKCLVGLLEEKGETFERINKYFGWRPKDEKGQDCFERKLKYKWPMQHQHRKIEEGSRAWQLIHAANKFDVRLYEFAKKLWEQQGEKLFPKR